MLSYTLFSQTVNGIVQDMETGKPLAGVNIYVLHTPLGTSSDEDGSFSIEGLSEGKYLATAELVGYQAHSFFLHVKENATSELKLSLEPSVLELNRRIVSTARRYKDEAFNLPEAVGLLSQQELARRIPRSTPEAMIGMTGVWMQKTNHGGGSPFVRGLTGNQTLILVDGIRLNNATFRYGPNQYLNTLDPSFINQIEVIRGSGSVLYGSDALGGVVQILTPDPVFSTKGLKVSGNTGVKYLSDDMEKSANATVTISTEKMALIANASANQFGDLVAGGDLGREAPSAYDQYGWNLKVKNKITDRTYLTTAMQYLRQDDVPRFDQVAIGKYDIYAFDPQIRFLTYARLQVFRENPLLRQFILTTSFHRSVEGRTKLRTAGTIRTRERDDVDTWGVTGEVHSEMSARWQMVSGIEYYGDRVESWRRDRDLETGQTEEKRGLYADGAGAQNLAVYNSNTFSFDRLQMRAGWRYNVVNIEANDDLFGSMEINPQALVGNISSIYRITDQYRWLLSVNTAFRAPNINDLSSFGTFDYGVEVPNSNLSPERSLTFETGIKKRSNFFSWALFAYRTNLYDLLERVEALYNGSGTYQGDPVYKKENQAKAYIQGAEVEAELRLRKGLNVYGGLTYTYGQNTSASEPMRRIPPLNSRLGIGYLPVQNVWLELEWLHAEKQDRLAGGDIDDHRIPAAGTPGWDVFNLRGNYQIGPVMISVGFQNLLDKAYRIHGSGTDGYGRSMYTALNYRF